MIIDFSFVSPEAEAAYLRDKVYGSDNAAGFDLRAIVSEAVIILPGEQKLIHTGIKVSMAKMHDRTNTPPYMRYAGLILPRSGRGTKEGLCLANLTGLIDEDYTGELIVAAWARPTSGHINAANNRVGGTPIHIEPGERIAQFVLVPVLRPTWNQVDEVTKTERGDGGFGSTGKA